MSRTGDRFNLLLRDLRTLKPEKESEVIENLSEVFKIAAESLASQNTVRISECLRFISESVQLLNDYLEEYESMEMEILRIRAKEYLNILFTYTSKNVSYQLLDQMEEYPFSMLILDKLRYSKASFTSIKDTVLNEEYTSEDVDVLNLTIDYLIDEGMVEEVEDGFALGDKGKELFNTYSASKRMTNKYERIKRQQINNRKATVNVELLNKIDKIPHGFKALEAFYNEGQKHLNLVDLSQQLEINSEELRQTLLELKNLYLIEEFDENVFMLLKSGENIFNTYRKSKRYTNTYERIKRKK